MRSLRPGRSLTHWKKHCVAACCVASSVYQGAADQTIILTVGLCQDTDTPRACCDHHDRLWRTRAGCGARGGRHSPPDLGCRSPFAQAEGHSPVRGPEVPVSGGRAGVWFQIIRLQSFCSAHGTTCQPQHGSNIIRPRLCTFTENPRLPKKFWRTVHQAFQELLLVRGLRDFFLPALMFSKLSNQYLGSICLYRTGVDTLLLADHCFSSLLLLHEQ